MINDVLVLYYVTGYFHYSLFMSSAMSVVLTSKGHLFFLLITHLFALMIGKLLYIGILLKPRFLPIQILVYFVTPKCVTIV